MRKHAVLTICFICTLHLYGVQAWAQQSGKPQKLTGQARIDSLLRELPVAKQDTNRVNLLYALSYGYRNINPDLGIKYGKEALAFATRLAWQQGIADANNTLGVNHMRKSDNDTARDYFQKAITIYEALGNEKGIAASTCNIGLIYHNYGDYSKALEYYFRALKADEAIGNKEYEANVDANIGNVYFSKNDPVTAAEYYFRALKIAEATGNRMTAANIRCTLGNVYYAKADYKTAMDYYSESLKMQEELGNKYSAAKALSNIGTVYSKTRDYKSAIIFTMKSLEINEEVGDKFGLAGSLEAIGSCYLHLAQDSSVASHILIPAMEVPDQKREPERIIPAGKAERLNLAISYLKRSTDSARKISAPEVLRDAYGSLADALALKGDYRGALLYYKLGSDVKDSIFSRENEKKIVEQQMRYDYEKKDARTRAEQEKKDLLANAALLKQKREKRFSYVVSILMLLIAGGAVYFVFYTRRVKKRERQMEIDHKVQLERGRISRDLHDNVGTQLSLINKSIQGIVSPLRATTDDEKTQQFLSVELAAKEVISNLRETIWAINKQEITLEELSDKLKEFAHKQLANVPSVRLRYNERLEDASIELSPAEALNLFRICQEGITNSIKYARASQIGIDLTAAKGKYTIVIADNGTGFELSGAEGKSYGLKNMKFRASEIGCSLKIDTAPETGTRITISKK